MMTDVPAWIFTVANISIAVVFAVILLNLYSKQSKTMLDMSERWAERLAELVEKSTAALAGVQSAVIALQSLVSALCDEVRGQRRGGQL